MDYITDSMDRKYKIRQWILLIAGLPNALLFGSSSAMAGDPPLKEFLWV